MPRTSPQRSTNSYLTPAEAAKMCRVNRFTVYSWIRTGTLPATTLKDGTIQIARQDLARILPTNKRRRYLTIAEAAKMCRVTSWTIRDWIYSGKLPATKMGSKLLRIDAQDVQRILAAKASASSRRGQRAAATNGHSTPQPSAPPVVVQTDAPSISAHGHSSAATTTNGHSEIEWDSDESCPCLSRTRRQGTFVGMIRRILGVIMPRPEFVEPEATPSSPTSIPEPDPSLTLAAVERAHIRLVLEQHHSNIDQAARVLGLSADTLRKKIGEMVREGITQNTANAPINVLDPGTNRWLE